MKYLLAFLLILVFAQCPAQFMYKTRYKRAIYAEVFATSPIASINFEYLPYRFQRSFIATRVGVGYIPGTIDKGISVPLSATYNFLPGNLKDKFMKRVKSSCNAQPKKIDFELFIETGVGYTFATYNDKGSKHFFSGILGLRTQIIFNTTPKARIIFLRFLATPTYTSTGEFELRGGAGLGVSI